MALSEDLLQLLQCPMCGSAVEQQSSTDTVRCVKTTCENGGPDGILQINGQPVLVDFRESVLDREALLKSGASSLIDRGGKPTLKRSIYTFLNGVNKVAGRNAQKLLAQIKSREKKPTVLIAGGASIGSGSDVLYEDSAIRIISFDIFASEYTDFVADGHKIPLKDCSVDAVWIQAVLEHVLQPERVVSEIHRVLKPQGLVYSEIPFMQQVHEGAYDFTRFTESGQRWLFRHFRCIESGIAQGPGTAALWSLRRLIAALIRQPRYGVLIGTGLFFWLRYFDRLIPRPYALDAACGIYYFGRKSDKPLSAKDVIEQYQGIPR